MEEEAIVDNIQLKMLLLTKMFSIEHASFHSAADGHIGAWK